MGKDQLEQTLLRLPEALWRAAPAVQTRPTVAQCKTDGKEAEQLTSSCAAEV